MASFSYRLFLSLVVFVFLLASPAGAQKNVENVKKGKTVSLRTSHKVAPAKARAKKKQKKTARVAARPSMQELKRQVKGYTQELEQRKQVQVPHKQELVQQVAEPRNSAGEGSTELQGKLTCRSAFVMDAKTGKVLYDRSADRPGQPASTIKVLTGLIAVESLDNQEMVRTSAYAANMPASKVYLKKGASYQATDLINAVLLASANDASVALAEKVAGSEQAFAQLMTKKAEALGAQNTICKSANGLTRPGQQTTARDLATVFNRAMRNPEFAERMSTVKVHTSDGKVLRSHNKALWTVDGAVGGKTGYTVAAGKTYVGKFQRDGQAIIVSLLGSASMWDDIATLVEHGFAKQEMASLHHEDAPAGTRVSLIKQKDQGKERVDYAMLTLTGQKKKIKM
jgi:D-alanyl-D-alanine carboxypeptidase (penicillin-binding protein 5/6)